MDKTQEVMKMVEDYATEHLDKSDGEIEFDVYVVWQCCILGNYKWLLSTTLADGMYYEVTWDTDRQCYYFDAYKKWENKTIYPNHRKETK